MAVQVIKATKTAGVPQAAARNQNRLRVAAYCRVSTDSDEQETSYEAQCRHYTDFINDNPNWILAGIYADEGLSGTSTKKREQFNKMIADCESGRIDMVITKSISRWARNTIDSLQNIRKLRDLGIPVLFEKENINTMDAKGEVLITIMSSIAQQESDSISKNVRMGIQYQMQQGKGRLNTAQFLGLTRDPDTKALTIIPEEAVLVRRIYREYLEGYSPAMIAARLTRDGIRTPAGKEIWYASTVTSILMNEKYAGDLLMQKYFTVDFLTHKVMQNTGQLPQYFVEDAHAPIVPKDVFYQVQGEMQRRSALRYDPTKFRCGASQALVGRLICGRCGRKLKRYRNPDANLTDWRCRVRAYEKRSVTKENEASCPCRRVLESEAKRAVIEAFNQLPGIRDELIRMQGAVWNGEIRRIDAALDAISAQRKRIAERVDNITIESDIGNDGGNDMVGGDEAAFLRAEMERLEVDHTELVLQRADAANTEVQIRLLLELVDGMKEQATTVASTVPDEHSDDGVAGACSDYEEFFRLTRSLTGSGLDEGIVGEDGKIMAFSNDLVIRYLDTVTILDEGYEVNFKCGLTVTVGTVRETA